MDDCLFCKIANKEVPAAIFYEDDKTLGFLDIKPHSLGHSVVILKKHTKDILDTPEDDLSNLIASIKKILEILKQSLNPDGFTIGINHGEIAGQAIGHLHIHILPRYKNDRGGSIHSVIFNPPKESIEETLNIIKNVNLKTKNDNVKC